MEVEARSGSMNDDKVKHTFISICILKTEEKNLHVKRETKNKNKKKAKNEKNNKVGSKIPVHFRTME